MRRLRKLLLSVVAAAALVSGTSAGLRAEVSKVNLAMQYGLGHLPMMLMQDRKLIEKHLKAAGLEGTTTGWFQLAGSAAMNDALLSGSVDFTSGGLTGIALLWARSGGKVKAASAICSMPMYLTTTNPNVKTLKDFTAADKIALPAVRVSPQAMVLQMAAQKEFGDHSKLDGLTVTMNHADAVAAVMSGSGAVNSHLGFPPYQEMLLKQPNVHLVMNSYDILGGPTTIPVLATRVAFHDENPKTYAAVVAALKEAIDFINGNKREAAQAYIDISKDKSMSLDEIEAILNKKDIVYSVSPHNSMQFIDFMYERGIMKTKPASWKDLYFQNVHDMPGAS